MKKGILVSLNQKGLRLTNNNVANCEYKCCICGTPFDEFGFCAHQHERGSGFALVNRNNKIEKICLSN